ncbi:MAG: cation-translocating P-type ATPase [Actinobacteria bacterium]|nr:cation-translocating P-type ATPase [Actinomycetota bacterium]
MATLEQTDLRLEGMSCSACVATIERSLNSIEGVSATVNFATETAHILAPINVTEKELIATVKKAGYGATLLSDESESFSRTKRMGWRVFFAGLFAAPVIAISMVMSLHHWVDEQTLSLLDRFALPTPLYSAVGWVAIGLTAPIIFIIAWPIHRARYEISLIPRWILWSRSVHSLLMVGRSMQTPPVLVISIPKLRQAFSSLLCLVDILKAKLRSEQVARSHISFTQSKRSVNSSW